MLIIQNRQTIRIIIFGYADDTLFEEKGHSNRVENMVNMAAMSGEPMKACFTYHEIEITYVLLRRYILFML